MDQFHSICNVACQIDVWWFGFGAFMAGMFAGYAARALPEPKR